MDFAASRRWGFGSRGSGGGEEGGVCGCAAMGGGELFGTGIFLVVIFNIL